MREMVRVVMVAFGVLGFLLGSIRAFVLLSARTERGVVEMLPMLEHGETTNVAHAVSGRRVLLRLEPDDRPASLKPGDSVTVLSYGKCGTLKFGRSYWREWKLAGGFAVVGIALVIGSLYILHKQPTASQTDATPPP
jgi:hypothetical protein